jgi:hypothetical protein
VHSWRTVDGHTPSRARIAAVPHYATFCRHFKRKHNDDEYCGRNKENTETSQLRGLLWFLN